MKILIGSDLVPTQSNIELFQNGDAERLVGERLLAVLQSADYRIFNLEVPLTDVARPIEKCGPALIAPTDTVAGYKALGVDLLTIANNHIMDQDEQGFWETLKTLSGNGIAYIGGGACLNEACQPYVLEQNGKRIGIYACAEHEFSIAGEASPGANPFDPLESPDHVAALKAQCDYVVVLYHGGKEHYRYPSPNLQKVCRKLVEKGADLVICQHSHCIGCEEKYQNGTIVYGQGNFLFDRSTSEYWQTSLLIQIEDDFSVSYIPLVKYGNAVRLATDEKAGEILAAFRSRSQEILDADALEQRYTAFANEMQEQYLLAMCAVNRRGFWWRVVNKLTGQRWTKWMLTCKYKKNKLIKLQNFLECEAHLEVMLYGLKNNEIRRKHE